MMVAALMITTNLVVDLTYASLDPRTRSGRV
jgi:ABC-type dipeptide/oligopeptide/nickel transport system permease component